MGKIDRRMQREFRERAMLHQPKLLEYLPSEDEFQTAYQKFSAEENRAANDAMKKLLHEKRAGADVNGK